MNNGTALRINARNKTITITVVIAFPESEVLNECTLPIGIFHKHTTLTIMPILASEASLRENNNIQQQNVTHSEDRTWASHELLIPSPTPSLLD